jgi:hypothetical protein
MAQDTAQPQADLQRISYAQYGFDIGLPRGSSKVPVPVQAPDGSVEVFVYRGLAIAVGVGRIPANMSASSAMDDMVRRMNLMRTSFETGQGVMFRGASGTFTLTKEMARGLPPSMPFRPGASVQMTIYTTPLPRDPSLMLALYAGGPAVQAANVDNLAKLVLSSISFIELKPGANSPATQQPSDSGAVLTSGQIALCGKVQSIKAESKSLTMLADTVVAYGQKPANLSPPREKSVTYSELPKDVAVGSRIVVVGKNAGTGKPMNADSIKLESPTAPTKSPEE